MALNTTHRWVSSLLSLLAVNRAVCRCRGNAPSARASSCMWAAVSGSPSYKITWFYRQLYELLLTSIIVFIIKPAALTIANEGCWNNLNRYRPSPSDTQDKLLTDNITNGNTHQPLILILYQTKHYLWFHCGDIQYAKSYHDNWWCSHLYGGQMENVKKSSRALTTSAPDPSFWNTTHQYH